MILNCFVPCSSSRRHFYTVEFRYLANTWHQETHCHSMNHTALHKSTSVHHLESLRFSYYLTAPFGFLSWGVISSACWRLGLRAPRGWGTTLLWSTRFPYQPFVGWMWRRWSACGISMPTTTPWHRWHARCGKGMGHRPEDGSYNVIQWCLYLSSLAGSLTIDNTIWNIYTFK